MQIEYIVREDNTRLLLIFAGWSTDASAFGGLVCSGYDVAVLSGYTDLSVPDDFSGYSEIVVMAWSLGVWAASNVLARYRKLPVTLTVAVNGTEAPVSDTEGIPERIYRSTLDGLTAQSLLKFRRRMGGGDLPLPSRSVDELGDELAVVLAAGAAAGIRWDRAVISDNDMIFPPDNQRRAWQGRADILEMTGAHVPDWQRIVDALVINKPLVSRRFARGLQTYMSEADVQIRIAEHLWSMCRKHCGSLNKTPLSILEIGYGNGAMTRLYAPELRPKRLVLWDILDIPSPFGETAICDGETAIMELAPDSVDMIISASTVQWFNSLPGFLERCAGVLAPGGLVVISSFGPQTFHELTEAGVTPLPYMSLESIRRIVPAGMELLELHEGIITKVFSSPIDVIRHLRSTGVNGRKSSVPLNKILTSYPLRSDGRAALTYNPVYFILRKSQ